MQRRPFKISYTVISTSHLSPFAQIRSAAAKEQQQLKRYAVHYSACLGHPFALVKEVVTLILLSSNLTIFSIPFSYCPLPPLAVKMERLLMAVMEFVGDGGTSTPV